MAKIEENQKKESQKENKCLFYKKWWFWIIISSILCCVNIAYAIWGCKTTNKSDILTAISGWISGVATLGVGLIAYRQNKVYKEENDKIEELHRQYDWRKEQKEIVKLYLENIIKAYEDLKEYQYSKVIEEMIKNNAKSVVVLEEMIYDQALKGINDNFISNVEDELSDYKFVIIDESQNIENEVLLKICKFCFDNKKKLYLLSDFNQNIYA
jgi:ABC-type iron transport system FetAB permease component